METKFYDFLLKEGLSEKSVKDDYGRMRMMEARGIDYQEEVDYVEKQLNRTTLSKSTISSCLRLCKRCHKFINEQNNLRQSGTTKVCDERKNLKMSIKAYGEFVEVDGFSFRIKTYIQFGKSNRSLGCFIMCNPGSAREGLGEQTIGTTVLKTDATMKQVIKVIQGRYGESVEGVVRIYNLFTLCEAKMDLAVKWAQQYKNEYEISYYDFDDFKKLEDKGDWVVVAWGCHTHKILTKLKAQWLTYLKQNGIVFYGLSGNDTYDYKHLLPPNVHTQEEIVEELIKRI